MARLNQSLGVNLAATHRVDLDAMIPREDFAVLQDGHGTDTLHLLSDFPISHLAKDAPILRLLRKPDFQRETNHWSPDQLVTFIESFVDGEVIPSLIFWKAPHHIFVIDGGHRLSALRAWMEDDYGDKHISLAFYKKDIPKKQIDIADRTRKLVERRVGRYSDLRAQVDSKEAAPLIRKRAQVLFTRALPLQWILNTSATAAETSFFKINSQGTPLDDTETLLIKNRRKSIAIGARAILRAGSGHKYWSGFDPKTAGEIEHVALQFHESIFKPEADEAAKTLELPLGGSISPVDALSLLVEFLEIAGSQSSGVKRIEHYHDDQTGGDTVSVLKNAFRLLNRLSSNSSGSLGLHPAVYFYNDKGRYSRFLFLGMVATVHDKITNNNSSWFKQFTDARKGLEEFLIINKSVIAMIISNLAKSARVPKVKALLEYLVKEFKDSKPVSIEDAIKELGLTGRIVDVRGMHLGPDITDEAKAAAYIKQAMIAVMRCPICGGFLDPKKSSTFDHILRKRDGGTGDQDNIQLVHPYCNDGYKN